MCARFAATALAPLAVFGCFYGHPLVGVLPSDRSAEDRLGAFALLLGGSLAPGIDGAPPDGEDPAPAPFAGLWTSVAAGPRWAARADAAASILNGRVYFLGGASAGTERGDLWSSADGLVWQEEIAAPPWAPLAFPGLAAFQNALWVVAGLDAGNDNVVSRSIDGQVWDVLLADGHGQFNARREHRLLAFDGRLRLIGGRTGLPGGGQRNVFSSADGSSWAQDVALAPWTATRTPCAAAFRERLWLLGGQIEGGAYVAEVWSSADGIHWQLETGAPGWSPRDRHGCVVFGNQLLLFGGRDGAGSLQDVWSSTDGVNWTQLADAPWTPRNSFSVVAWNQKVWIMAGRDGAGIELDEIWSGE